MNKDEPKPKTTSRLAVDIAEQAKQAVLDVLNYSIEANSCPTLISIIFLTLRAECKRSGPFTAQQLYILSDRECSVIEELRRHPQP